MHNFEYIANFDLDELIVPNEVYDVPAMIDLEQKDRNGQLWDSVLYQSFYFPNKSDKEFVRYVSILANDYICAIIWALPLSYSL